MLFEKFTHGSLVHSSSITPISKPLKDCTHCEWTAILREIPMKIIPRGQQQIYPDPWWYQVLDLACTLEVPQPMLKRKRNELPNSWTFSVFCPFEDLLNISWTRHLLWKFLAACDLTHFCYTKLSYIYFLLEGAFPLPGITTSVCILQPSLLKIKTENNTRIRNALISMLFWEN